MTVAERKAADGAADGQAPMPGARDIAPLSRRFGALVVDWVLSLLVASIFTDPRATWWAPLAVLVVEYALFVGLFGQTPGMRLAGIQCVSATHGRPVGPLAATLRGLLLCVVVPALIMDGYGRGLHDRAVGSVVLMNR